MHAFKNQEALTTYSKERRRQGAGSEVVKWWFVCVVSVRMTSFWVLLLRCWLQTAVCWTLSAPLCAADHTASKARWEARCCGGEERRGEERRGGGEEGRLGLSAAWPTATTCGHVEETPCISPPQVHCLPLKVQCSGFWGHLTEIFNS